jgi:8-oxo-dGTP pyrophosphatase MutT (NUDIX family)
MKVKINFEFSKILSIFVNKNKKTMKISAGTCIIYKNKILFCHPTNGSWTGTYSPAKGGVDNDEKIIDAAIRETKEEVGIDITLSMISNANTPIEIIYYNKKKEIHKMVYLFLVKINDLSEIGLTSEIVPKTQLQVEEVDWAGFLTVSEIKEKSFHRFLPLIELLEKEIA